MKEAGGAVIDTSGGRFYYTAQLKTRIKIVIAIAAKKNQIFK